MSGPLTTPELQTDVLAAHSLRRLVRPCPIGTLVSYRTVDGTCRKVENYRHAWLKDGTCANCGMTRKEAGYSRNPKPKEKRRGSGFLWRMIAQMEKCERTNTKLSGGGPLGNPQTEAESRRLLK